MPMTPTEETWASSHSLDLSVLADTSTSTTVAKSLLWAIKSILMGQIGTHTQGLWTCVGSSPGDGTFNMSGTDTWGSTYNGAKLVRATAGSNHSWMCLKSPVDLGGTGIFHYLVIDWSTASDTTVTMVYGRQAPTGGSATAAPTMTNSWTHSATAFNAAVSGTHKMHISVTPTGMAHVLWSRTAANRITGALSIMDVKKDCRLTDTYRVVCLLDHNDSTGAWYSNNSSGYCGSTPGLKGRYYDGSAATAMSILCFIATNNSATQFTVNQTVPNPFDGLADDFPAYVVYNAASFYGKKGRVPDVWPAITPSGQPTVYPSSGTASHILVGNTFIPMVGTPTL